MNTDLRDVRSESSAHADLPRRTALIIEADRLFSQVLAHHLQRAGYQPLPVYQGRAAIAACAQRPALITLCISLPDMDGWSVLREIKNLPAMSQVPVVIISSAGEDHPDPESGPTVFVNKPVRRMELIEAIERLALGGDALTRVLHVDDDPLMGDLVQSMLPGSRFQVRTAASARAAAEALAAEMPDLVLLDLVMPKVSGFEFLQTLRADPRTRSLPVLVLTAKHLSLHEQDELTQAAQLVISKADFSPDELMAKLQRLERAAPLLHHAVEAPEPPPPADDEIDLSQFRDDFLREAQECLSLLDAVGEQGQCSEATLGQAMRAAHTLKGTAGLMGHAELSHLSAQAEQLLQSEIGSLAPSLDALRDIHRRMAAIVSGL
jgi:CheY-like chemotaxis protein